MQASTRSWPDRSSFLLNLSNMCVIFFPYICLNVHFLIGNMTEWIKCFYILCVFILNMLKLSKFIGNGTPWIKLWNKQTLFRLWINVYIANGLSHIAVIVIHQKCIGLTNARSRHKQTFFVHDDVIKRKHFPFYWPFVRGIHRSPVNSPHKGQWRGAKMKQHGNTLFWRHISARTSQFTVHSIVCRNACSC